ncbi:MAG TPA: HXXEE domain-containing protein [Opitutaceae bacterium]|nr:HXXEE domain-containing protein [Opitutaceae bacterium]
MDKLARQFGNAWLTLTAVLAVHVTDEALTDFLSFYNPSVRAVRARLPWLPLPTFTFDVWLAGLIAAIALLTALSAFAFRGRRLAVWLAYPYAVIMFANGCGHLGGSLYFGRWLPGSTSAPLLLAASAWLLLAARRLTGAPVDRGPA